MRPRMNVYNSLIMSHLLYGNIIFSCTSQKNIRYIETMQKKALRHVCKAKYNAHTAPLFIKLNQLNFDDSVTMSRALFMHKFKFGHLPASFDNFYEFKSQIGANRVREDDGKIHVPTFNYPSVLSPKWECAKTWNGLPINIRNISKENDFKSSLKTFLISKYEAECSVLDCKICNPN